ncbi:hypothetical protein [Yoonia sp.]|uniref:hypothetical protein n=1 Tax=Yoonia sp. TaxID=2212373 RepID=UPI0025DF7541|nr:hypothetical protein [Yoonia sp.]
MTAPRKDPAAAERRKMVAQNFQHWVGRARELVHANFGGNEAELQHLTLQAAHSLMLEHRLGEIEANMADIKSLLTSPARPAEE